MEAPGLNLGDGVNGRNGKKTPLVDSLKPIQTLHPGSNEHIVQFYEKDDFILDSISEFLKTGFDRGEAAIVAAPAIISTVSTLF